MRQFLSLALVASLPLASVSVAFAQDAENTTFNAPTNATAVVTANSTNLGEFKEVACTDPLWVQNSCNQCFTGKSVKVGEKLTGLFDNWTNSTDAILVAEKDAQKIPNMVSFGASWVSSNADESKMWKNSPDVLWTPNTTTAKDEFYLQPGQKIRFMESDLGAGYTLESSTKKHGEIIGMLRFPVVYHTTDMTSGNKSDAMTHYECVTYTLDAPTTPTTPTPGKPTPKTPTPKTEVETGPAETLVLIIAAFFIAFGLMLSLRKR